MTHIILPPMGVAKCTRWEITIYNVIVNQGIEGLSFDNPDVATV